MTTLEFLFVTLVGGFYLFLPAYAANMAPVGASSFFRRMGWWNAPIWEGKLGKNKTWVGTIAGLTAAVIVAGIQARLSSTPFFENLRPVVINDHPWFRLGLLVGLGALVVGDMGKSLLKRGRGIKPGTPWKP